MYKTDQGCYRDRMVPPTALVRVCVVKAFHIKSFLTSRNLCVVTCGFFHSTIRSPHHSGASFSHKSFEGPTKVCCPSALPASAWRYRPSDCALPRRSCHPPFGPDPRRSSTLGCTVGRWRALPGSSNSPPSSSASLEPPRVHSSRPRLPRPP